MVGCICCPLSAPSKSRRASLSVAVVYARGCHKESTKMASISQSHHTFWEQASGICLREDHSRKNHPAVRCPGEIRCERNSLLRTWRFVHKQLTFVHKDGRCESEYLVHHPTKRTCSTALEAPFMRVVAMPAVADGLGDISSAICSLWRAATKDRPFLSRSRFAWT